MLILIFLFKIFIDFYIIQLLLRIWMEYLNCDFYHPLSQVIFQITQPFILLTQNNKYISKIKFFLLIYILLLFKIFILIYFKLNMFYITYLILLINFVSFFKILGKLIIFILILQSYLSWGYFKYNYVGLIISQLMNKLNFYLNYNFFIFNYINIFNVLIVIFFYFLNLLGFLLFSKFWYLI